MRQFPGCFPILLLLLAQAHGAKIITVSASGKNLCSCWDGVEGSPCLTLDYALGGLDSSTAIQVNYSHSFSNTTFSNITSNVSRPMENIALVGIGQPVINCTALGAGLAFWGLTNITISGISWEGCSVATPTATILEGETIQAYRALFFYNVTNLIIEDCQFSSQGRGAGVALYDVAGDVRIINSNFSDNTVSKDLWCPKVYNKSVVLDCSPQGGGLYVELMDCRRFTECDQSGQGTTGVNNSIYTIDGCTFEHNTNVLSFQDSFRHNLSTHSFRSFGHGAGLALAVMGDSTGNRFTIINSQFVNNTAYTGGGMYVILLSHTRGNTVVLSGVDFSGNRVDRQNGNGGGIAIGAEISESEENPDRLLFQGVVMRDNHAAWGGGLLVFFGNLTRTLFPFYTHGPVMEFTNCTWQSCSAVRAGAAVALFHFLPVDSIAVTSTVFTDCTIEENFIPRAGGRTQRFGYGSIYALAAPLSFNGTTLIRNNSGSAVVISAAKIHFAGNVEFTYNQGIAGSGIFLTDISTLFLHKGLDMRFSHNDAFDTGGAIYYTYPGVRSFSITGSCFFQYEDPSLPPSKWDVSVTFSGNKALYGGSAIFLSDPSGCRWPNDEFLFDVEKEHPLNFTGNIDPKKYGSILGTPAENLTFLSPVNFSGEYYSLEVFPGQELDLPVVIQDYFNSSSVTATLDTKCFNYSLFVQDMFFSDFCASGTGITYKGPRVFVAGDSITGISLGGPENNSDLVLVLKTIEAQAIVTVLRVFFTECQYGFYYNTESNTCQCYDDDKAVRCFNFNGTFQPCILSGHWYGTIDTDQGSSYAEGACTLDTCSVSCKERCLNVQGWCKLPATDHDLCRGNHGGPLCAYCQEGFSPNYGQLHCVPSDECNAETSVLLVCLMVLFWAVIIISLLVILRLNLRLGSGYMYGFIYYFSVLPFIAGNIVQSHAFSAFVSFFYSLAHLDPHFLSFFKLCFAKDITPVQLEFFHYFHPLLVTVLIYLVILMNRYCPRLPVLSVYAPVHALCLILLLSYTSLFQTSFAILQPLHFLNARPKTSEIFVRLQPRTSYFDPKDHLPYALVALAVELVLVLPFTVVMLLAPWLMRWGKMTKFKPILDEFQSCYKDSYRWFAGYYLLCRQLIALPPFFSNTPSGGVFLQQILSITILLGHAYIQPYRERWLNLLDTVFLFDLALVSILSGDTARTVFSGTLYDLTLTLKIILITIPCFYLFLACAVVFWVKFQGWYRTKYQTKTNTTEENNGTHTSSQDNAYEVIPDTAAQRRGVRHPTMSVVMFQPLDVDSQEENPLLEHEAESFVVSISDRQLEQDAHTRRPSSRGTGLLRRVAHGLSSQVSYWRNTASQSTRESYRARNEQDLPELREHETLRI